MDTNFNERSVSHLMEVLDERSTTFRTEHVFEIHARSPSRFFKRQYTWTGGGNANEQLPALVTEHDVWGGPKHKLHGPQIIEGNSRIVLVDLGRTLAAGQREKVHFCHQLKDLSGTFIPHLGVSPKPPRKSTKRLELAVILPPSLGGSVVFEAYYSHGGAVSSVENLPHNVLQNGKYEYRKIVEKPELANTGYRIRW